MLLQVFKASHSDCFVIFIFLTRLQEKIRCSRQHCLYNLALTPRSSRLFFVLSGAV